MKLNKETCQVCWLKDEEQTGRRKSVEKDDEDAWKFGTVYCLFDGGWFGFEMDEIPDRCKYKLEHIVLGKRKIK